MHAAIGSATLLTTDFSCDVPVLFAEPRIRLDVAEPLAAVVLTAAASMRGRRRSQGSGMAVFHA
jgi:hypothetical protein